LKSVQEAARSIGQSERRRGGRHASLAPSPSPSPPPSPSSSPEVSAGEESDGEPEMHGRHGGRMTRRMAQERQAQKRSRRVLVSDSSSGGSPPAAPAPQCCGKGRAVLRTSNTPKNPGRQFWCCPAPKEGGCGYFQWLDEPPRAGSGAGAAGAGGDPAPEGPPCPCGAGPCKVLTAKTERNNGRTFYKCPAPNGCNFFQWSDEAGGSCAGSAGRPGRFAQFLRRPAPEADGFARAPLRDAL
jgi:hypothetical protein